MSLRNALSMRAAALRRAPSPPPVTGRRRASSSDRRDHRRPQSRALSLSPRHRHNQKRPLSPNPGGLTPPRAQRARSWLRRTGDGDRAKRSCLADVSWLTNQQKLCLQHALKYIETKLSKDGA